MVLPKPVPGQVIRYSYLWADEYLRGREDGSKDRPCVVTLVFSRPDIGGELVTLLPITHSVPSDMSLALEIPLRTKIRLGLDEIRSWIVISEANQFLWPGPDLRWVNDGEKATIVYGLLPLNLLEQMRAKFIANIRAKRLSLIPRSE